MMGHFHPPVSRRTTAVVDVRELCTVVARIVSDTLMVASVTIWLWQEDAAKQVRLGGSTVFGEDQAYPPGVTAQRMAELVA